MPTGNGLHQLAICFSRTAQSIATGPSVWEKTQGDWSAKQSSIRVVCVLLTLASRASEWHTREERIQLGTSVRLSASTHLQLEWALFVALILLGHKLVRHLCGPPTKHRCLQTIQADHVRFHLLDEGRGSSPLMRGTESSAQKRASWRDLASLQPEQRVAADGPRHWPSFAVTQQPRLQHALTSPVLV